MARSRQAAERQPEVPSRPRPRRPMGKVRWSSAPRAADGPGAGQRAGSAHWPAAEREGPFGLQGGSVPGPLPVGRPARGPELQAATFGRGGSRPSPVMLLFRLSQAASEPASPILSLPWLCARLGSLARGCKCGESEAASATPKTGEVHSAAIAVQASLQSSPHSNGNTASRPMH
jgi:hypothetical protein